MSNLEFMLNVIYSCETPGQLQSCLVWISNLMRGNKYDGLIALHHVELQALTLKIKLISSTYENL